MTGILGCAPAGHGTPTLLRWRGYRFSFYNREPDEERMHVLLQDGREISVRLWWYPRLLHATPEQRERWEILPFADALHSEAIDENLDVWGFLIRAKAPDAKPPVSSLRKIPSWRRGGARGDAARGRAGPHWQNVNPLRV
jgi:Protein of unknown function (DUF2442)